MDKTAWKPVFEHAMDELTTQGSARDHKFTVDDAVSWPWEPVTKQVGDFETWVGIFRLKDDRFAFLQVRYDAARTPFANCIVSDDLEKLVRLGMDQDARDQLGVV